MAPLLTNSFALFGLLALPVLVAIYLLRTQYRPLPVSSLMLWLDQKELRKGGRTIDRLQTPLTLFLEILLILLLILAATGPMIPGSLGARPLVVVLDDSYSMLAGQPDSPQARALAALSEELRLTPRYSIRFVLAGERPTTLGGTARNWAEAEAILAGWTCRSSVGRLDQAINFAREIGGEWSVMLVLTDRAVPSEPEKGRLRWWAFGQPQANIAIVNATRTVRDEAERVLLEIANLSGESQSTNLTLTVGEQPPQPQTLQLSARELRRIVLQLPEVAGPLRANLSEDALTIDNSVTLHPAAVPKVRVNVNLADAAIQKAVRKAVESSKRAVISNLKPDLLVSDGSETSGPDAWVLRLIVEKEAESFAGPFVIDRTHPLTEGLTLAGAIWGGGRGDLLGRPVVLAGNVPLLTDTELRQEQHEIRLRVRPDLSTWTDTPAWPILFWNLIDWRATKMPGLSRANLRLGEEVTLTLPASEKKQSVRLNGPEGLARDLPVASGRVVIPCETVGEFEVQAGSVQHRFAVGALNREESDLRNAVTGQWGDWYDEAGIRLDYQSAAWILLLMALAVFTLHAWVARRDY